MAHYPNIKIAQIHSISGKMSDTIYNYKYISKTDIHYYKRVGIVSILLTNNTFDSLHTITSDIDKGTITIIYGDDISKHDSYIFDGRVIASAFFKGNNDLHELDCTLRTGKAIDGTIIFQILYKYQGSNYCVKLPTDVTLEQITEYGINFNSGNRLMFIQTFAGLSYYANFYKISMSGYVEFIRI